MINRMLSLAIAALIVCSAGSASAEQSKCLAGKTKCASKEAAGLLKCEQAAETPGKPADPNAGGCVDKVNLKFDGGPTPAKGCFEKLEGKVPNDCLTLDDTAAAEAAISSSCVGAFVAAIDPAPIDQTKCGVGKKKCVSKYLAAVLKCVAKAQTPNAPSDPNAGGCLDKAKAKYDGGADPAKGCFAKLEAKNPNDCLTTGDSSALHDLVEDCSDKLEALLTATTTTTTTTTLSTTTTTTMPGGQVLFGALTATPGRFNYNLTLGLPGANSACNSNFAGTHACSYAELQAAETHGDLIGLKDTGNNTVTTFWAIDSAAAPLSQCQDDVSSFNNWEYGTAHTLSRGDFVNLTNGTGVLGSLQHGQQCNFTSKSVGCCL